MLASTLVIYMYFLVKKIYIYYLGTSLTPARYIHYHIYYDSVEVRLKVYISKFVKQTSRFSNITAGVVILLRGIVCKMILYLTLNRFCITAENKILSTSSQDYVTPVRESFVRKLSLLYFAAYIMPVQVLNTEG